MTNKQPVFNVVKAKELMRRGHVCLGCELNRMDENKVVFYFEKSEAVRKDLVDIGKNLSK